MSKQPKTYVDAFTCGDCKRKGLIRRRTTSAGRMVRTYCNWCFHQSLVLAGPLPKDNTDA